MPHLVKGIYPNNDIKMVLDPTGIHAKVKPEIIMQTLGLVPSFFDEEDLQALISQAEANYGSYLPQMNGVVDSRSMAYKHEGDSDLFPLALYERLTDNCMERVFQYQYGIIAFHTIEDGTSRWFITRMD